MLDDKKLWSLESEAAALGSMMIDRRCIGQILGIIDEQSFFKPEHGKIYAALVRLYMANQATDAVMLRGELTRAGELEKVGGVDYIRQVLESVPSAESAEYYAKVVRDRAAYRSLLRAIEGMQAAADDGQSVSEQIRQVQELALGLKDSGQSRVYESGEATKIIDWIGPGRELMSTGYHNLDWFTGGFGPGEMVILAARPGIGKSALALNIACNAAKAGKSVVFFTLEMTHRALIERAVCYVGQIDACELRKNRQHGPENTEFMGKISEAAWAVKEMKLVFHEGAETVAEQTGYIRTRKLIQGVDLVVIDYIQLMSAQGESRVQEVSAISRGLKLMAMSEQIPILALCQLNRQTESRKSHRPHLSDLRESGALEQDADIVILLHREHYYRRLEKPDAEDMDGSTEAIIAKNRRGRTGVAKLVWIEERTSFGDMTDDNKQS